MRFPIMALVVFIRGVNVGGHRTLRPSVLVRGLSDYGVVNVVHESVPWRPPAMKRTCGRGRGRTGVPGSKVQ